MIKCTTSTTSCNFVAALNRTHARTARRPSTGLRYAMRPREEDLLLLRIAKNKHLKRFLTFNCTLSVLFLFSLPVVS